MEINKTVAMSAGRVVGSSYILHWCSCYADDNTQVNGKLALMIVEYSKKQRHQYLT